MGSGVFTETKSLIPEHWQEHHFNRKNPSVGPGLSGGELPTNRVMVKEKTGQTEKEKDTYRIHIFRYISYKYIMKNLSSSVGQRSVYKYE